MIYYLISDDKSRLPASQPGQTSNQEEEQFKFPLPCTPFCSCSTSLTSFSTCLDLDSYSRYADQQLFPTMMELQSPLRSKPSTAHICFMCCAFFINLLLSSVFFFVSRAKCKVNYTMIEKYLFASKDYWLLRKEI